MESVRDAPSAGWVGVLMLDTRFARPPGDIGNPQTFAELGIPVRHMIVNGSSAQTIVRGQRADWLDRFVDAARSLECDGATLITTTCGFLAEFQPALQAAVRVPVLSSALLQCAAWPNCGIVTFDAQALTPAVLAGAGVPAGTPIAGLEPGCELQRVIYGDLPELDMDAACANVVQAALNLLRDHPQLDTLVLECANMPPYRTAVERTTGRRTLDALTLLTNAWMRRGTTGFHR